MARQRSNTNDQNELIMPPAELLGLSFEEVIAALFGVEAQDIAFASEIPDDKASTLQSKLVAAKKMTQAQVAQAQAAQLGMPFYASLHIKDVPETLLSKLPIAFAKQNRILPVEETEEGTIRGILSNPTDLAVADEVRFLYGKELELAVVPPDVLLTNINRVYDRATRQAEAAVQELEEAGQTLVGDLEVEVVDLLDLDGDDEAPIIRLVNSLLTQSVKDRASDIHIEPFEKDLVVRFRVDGVLYEIIRPPKRFQNSIISRVKIMGGLNIAEKRLPQDGRIRLKVAGRDFDIRVSSIPTSHGERIVMRLLERSAALFGLEALGFSKSNFQKMEKLIHAPHGIILVTGPTGSGKTSTLYAGLSSINKPSLNILTIEDPVEYQLEGVGQVQVNSKIDLTFANGLRSFLRQDPDVIMVGEIRDRETAEISIQASLTGHLVLSTVHTNDSAGAITRLVDMQVEPFLVASSLLAVLAQRLVRTICPRCKEEYKPSPGELAELSLDPKTVKKLWRGKGCPNCQNTGYIGRLGIFELMVVDDDIRRLVLENADASTIKAESRRKGMITLREDGADKVLKGVTTIEEVSRVSREEDVTNEI